MVSSSLGIRCIKSEEVRLRRAVWCLNWFRVCFEPSCWPTFWSRSIWIPVSQHVWIGWPEFVETLREPSRSDKKWCCVWWWTCWNFINAHMYTLWFVDTGSQKLLETTIETTQRLQQQRPLLFHLRWLEVLKVWSKRNWLKLGLTIPLNSCSGHQRKILCRRILLKAWVPDLFFLGAGLTDLI